MKRFDPTGGRLLPLAPLVPPSGVVPATSKGQASSEQASADDIGAVLAGGTNDGIVAVYNTLLRAVNLTNSDKGSTARAAHEAAANPHPQYAALAGATFTGAVTAPSLQATGLGTFRALLTTTGGAPGDVRLDVNSPAGQTAALARWSINSAQVALLEAAGNFSLRRAGGAASFVGGRVGGTLAAPTAVAGGDFLTSWASTGWNGTAHVNGGTVSLAAAETYTASARGTDLVVSLAGIGSTTLTERLRVSANGGMEFRTVSSQAMRIMSDNAVLVGPQTSRLTPALMETQGVHAVVTSSDTTEAFGLETYKRRIAGTGAVQVGDRLGRVRFRGFSDTGEWSDAVWFETRVTAAPTGGVVRGDLRIATRNAVSFTTRLFLSEDGAVGMGSESVAGIGIRMARTLDGGATFTRGIWSNPVVPTTATDVTCFDSTPNLVAASAGQTINRVWHYAANNIGNATGNTINQQFGFLVNDLTAGSTNNFGFHGNLSAGAGKFNLFMVGTAINYLNGDVGIKTQSPTAAVDINDNTLRLRGTRTPASAMAAGNQGDICWDASFLYLCVAANTWRRVAHATW